MRVGSVCSGIGAERVAWSDFGWEHGFFSETDAFPSEVLRQRYPETPNLGDFTKIGDGHDIDLLVGGTPCQSFSIGGRKSGFTDPRGNLTLEFIRLAYRLQPTWILWENVPHFRRINGGRDFLAFLDLVAEYGYGYCWRTLDARGFGVPQKRPRMFLVGHLGDWRPCARVLCDPDILPELSPISRRERQGATGKPAEDPRTPKCLTPWVPQRRRVHDISRPSPTLAYSDKAGGHRTPTILDERIDRVRRLSPVESERLQGLPDNYTRISWRGKREEDCPEGLRYAAISNSWAVPVVRTIGEQIKKEATK